MNSRWLQATRSVQREHAMRAPAVGTAVFCQADGMISSSIQLATCSCVSHVGILATDGGPGGPPLVVEALSSGLVVTRLSDVIARSRHVWTIAAVGLRPTAAAAWLALLEPRPYGWLGAALSWLPWAGLVAEDLSRYHCSEVLALMLRDLRIIPSDTNVSMITPADLLRWNIWDASSLVEYKLPDAGGSTFSVELATLDPPMVRRGRWFWERTIPATLEA